jgi:membrane fusion protein
MDDLRRTEGIQSVAPAISNEALPETGGPGANVPSQPSLFRQEVLEFQQQHRQWGRVVPLQPLSTRLLIWCAFAAAAGAIAFLFVAKYAREENAPGYLVPLSGTARVFAPQPGTISAVYVQQGDNVEKGQSLLAVVTSQVAASGEDVNATILNNLEQQKMALTRNIADEVHRTEVERQRLTAQIQEHQGIFDEINAQMVVQRKRIKILENMVAAGAQLRSKGLVSEIDQSHRQEALLEKQQALISLDQQAMARQGQTSDANFALQQLPFAQADKLQMLRNQLSATEQQIAEVTGRSAYIVRAPVGGRVSLMQASMGQQADPRRLQLQIVPDHSPLEARLFIPVRAIGFVTVGQNVKLLFDAFPYQRFGTYHGRITTVSQTVLLPSDIDGPVTLREPAYTATVALDRPDIIANGKSVPLRPDMSLRADIILEKRTLADWIFAPLRHLRIDG